MPPRPAGHAEHPGVLLGRPRALAALCLLVVRLAPAAAQTEWFDVTKFRGPAQCERMGCLSVRLENCRDHLHGFYLREKGCHNGQICTDCNHGNMTVAGICYCENPPYNVGVTYGQNCGMGKACEEGDCFRPCHTFLHSTTCPGDYCKWESLTKSCIDKPPTPEDAEWIVAQDGPSRPAINEAEDVVILTSPYAYPMDFQTFRSSALGFRIFGVLVDDLIDLQSLFLEMDENTNGELSKEEFAVLPIVMQRVELQARQHLDREAQAESQAEAAQQEAQRRRLQDADAAAEEAEVGAGGRRLFNATITPETCNSKRPREYYCSFDVSCKKDCRECGWKSATDTAFASCVRPTPEACYADGAKVFCDSDQMCHPSGDCSNCVDRPIVDHSQHRCLQLWWGPKPLPQMKDWVCRFRNKNGMRCFHDQDCVYGMKRCLGGACQPFQPYNPNQTCVSDLDCPHSGYYCPPDPTGGKNKFWVQYCRLQGDEEMTCKADRECKPDLRCNTAEPQPRCRRLFSMPLGALASEDILCEHSWRDRNFKCAPPPKSKQLGRPCDVHSDCSTTDITGRPGECVCKKWWEYADPTYCNPVAGDYANHQEKLRDYLAFRASNCGTFWTEEECLREHGDTAKRLKLAIECETQQLVGGPYLPKEDCGIGDDDRFPDSCARLTALG